MYLGVFYEIFVLPILLPDNNRSFTHQTAAVAIMIVITWSMSQLSVLIYVYMNKLYFTCMLILKVHQTYCIV